MKKVIITAVVIAFVILAAHVFKRTSNEQKLILFYSNYCPHCKVVRERIEKLKLNITLCCVDTELKGVCKRISKNISLNYVPTLVIIKNGKIRVLIGSKNILWYFKTFSLFPPLQN